MFLSTIHNRNELIRPIANANGLDHDSAAAIASTSLMIAEIQSFIDDSSPKSSFDPSCLILFPPSSPPSPPPPDFVRHYLHRLARDAQADATDRACSSILAGQGSESDDTGDIALWLGPNNHSTPDLVLKSLGLSEWSANGEVAVSNFVIPSGLRIEGLLSELEEKFSFRASASMTGGVVLFFLIGRISGEWGGLVGIGTWSDVVTGLT